MSFSADETVASASAVAVPHSGAKRLHHEAFSSISDDATPTATAAAAASCGNQQPNRSKRRRNSRSPAPPPKSPVPEKVCSDDQWAQLVAHLHAEADTVAPEEGDADVRRVLLRFAKSTLDGPQWDSAVAEMTLEVSRPPEEKNHFGKIIKMRKEEMQCLLRLLCGSDALEVIEALIESRKGWARKPGVFPVLAGVVSVLWRRLDRPVGISEASGFFRRDVNQNYVATDAFWEAIDGTGESWPPAMRGNKLRQLSPAAAGIASSSSGSDGACHSEISNAFGMAGAAVNNMAPTGDDDEGETTSIMVPGHRSYSLTTGLIVDRNPSDEYPGIISNDVAQAGDMTQQQAFEQCPLGYEALADQNSDIDLHDLLAEFDDAPSFDNMWDSPGFNTAHLQGAHAAGTCSALAEVDFDEAFATMTHHLADPVTGDHQALLGDDAPAYCELDHPGHFRSVMGEQAFVSSVDYDLFITQELEEMFSGGSITTPATVLIGRQCAV